MPALDDASVLARRQEFLLLASGSNYCEKVEGAAETGLQTPWQAVPPIRFRFVSGDAENA